MNISIAMCTFNGERFLTQQLESFIGQVRKPDELIVCDDGSNDGTIALLRIFAERAPFSVRIVENQTNLGSTQNFVKAISLCTGDIIALSDQDDIWKAEKLSTLTKVLTEDPSIGGVFSNADLIDDQSRHAGGSLWGAIGYTPAMQAKLQRGTPFQILQKQPFVTGATLLFRANLRERFTTIPPGWVHDAWIAWQLAIYSRLVGIPQSLIQYRIHGANQIGVADKSARTLLKQRTVSRMRHVLEAEIKQLNDLLLNIDDSNSAQSDEAAVTVRKRIRFLNFRKEAIAQPKAVRLVSTVAAWPDYRKFAKGLRSILGDAML